MFGLSKVYFHWFVMVKSRIFMDLDIVFVQLIFEVLCVIKMNFSLTRQVWSALLCIRFVNSCYLGYPSCPKSIYFGTIRLVQSFFQWLVMAWSSLFTDVELVELIFNVLGVMGMNFLNNPACLKCIFMHPVCPTLLFRVFGLSQNNILGIGLIRSSFFMCSICPKSSFIGSWWSKVEYSWIWTLYSLFLKY